MKKINKISRRSFLGQASCAGLGYLSLASTLTSLRAMNASAISNSSINANGDYKAIVVLFKFGGNDSFNTLIPNDTANYNEYLSERGNVALAQNTLLPINLTSPDPNGRLFGLHPSLGGLQSLFNSGKAAFVANVGTKMKSDMTVSDYQNGLHIPVGLYSHNDQQEMWQTSITDRRTAIGWGGRIADLINDQNTNTNISMSISLSGINTFQIGNVESEYSITPSGSVGYTGYGGSDDRNQARTAGLNGFMEHQYNDIFKQTYADMLRSSRDAHAIFSSAIANASTFNQFSGSPLGANMEMIAKTISVKDDLGLNRQIFFVGIGGWDAHSNLLADHSDLLSVVDPDLTAFSNAMEQINMEDQVLLLEMSEFGRTISSNNNGTDHAWGGHVYAVGGTNLINGGLVHGNYPSLVYGPNNPYNAESRGRMIPGISTEEYFGEIARWFGVPASELNYVFPNIGEFYDYINDKHPVGILKPYV